MQLTHYALG